MPARKSRPTGATAPAGPPNSSPSVAQPSTNGMVVQRERLHALIDARLPGAVWLQGPTGAGKTVLLRSYLQRDRCPSIWLSADERHRDPAALFAAITAVAQVHCDGALPAFSPEHRDEPDAFARGYFTRLDQGVPQTFAFVIDDLHELVGTTAPLLAFAIDAFEGRRRACFASQLMPDPGFALQLATSRLWIVGHKQLAFDLDEARGLATRVGSSADALDALVHATDGWAAGLMLAMQFGSSGGTGNGSDDPLQGVRTPLALLIASQVLGGLAPSDLARLRMLAELPQVPVEIGDLLPDWSAACMRLQAMSERGLFVERLAVERSRVSDPAQGIPRIARASKGCWRLHDLLRGALREQGTVDAFDGALGDALTATLVQIDRIDLAWQLAVRIGAAALTDLVVRHGRSALQDSHATAMVQVTAPHATRNAPHVALWQARANWATTTSRRSRAARKPIGASKTGTMQREPRCPHRSRSSSSSRRSTRWARCRAGPNA